MSKPKCRRNDKFQSPERWWWKGFDIWILTFGIPEGVGCRLKIGLVTHCYPLYEGDIYGNWIPGFVCELEARGHRVWILTPRMEGEGAPLQRGIQIGGTKRGLSAEANRVRSFEWLGGEKRLAELRLYHPIDLLSLVSLVRKGTHELARLVEEQGIAFCLASWALPNGYFCYRIKRKLGVPYGVWTLGSDINVYGGKPILKGILKAVLEEADLLFSNGFSLSGKVEAFCGRMPQFMPTNRRLPEGAERIALERDVPHFLYVGRLEAVKGTDVLIEGMKALMEGGTIARLTLLGDGRLRGALEKRARDYGLADRITFVGFVRAETVAAYLRACDFLVIPSRSEGMPVVFHEAMQTQVPVIATDVGDLGPLIREYGVGKTVPPGSPEALAAAMRQAVAEGREAFQDRMDELWRRFDVGAAAETLSEAIGHLRGQRADG